MGYIKIQEFKSQTLNFNELKIPFGKITMLTGNNSIGKSLILKSIANYSKSLFLDSEKTYCFGVSSITPSIFSIEVNEKAPVTFISKFLNMHKSIVKIFLDDEEEKQFTSLHDLCIKLFKDSKFSEGIFIEIIPRKNSDIDNILSLFYNIKYSTTCSKEDLELLEDYSLDLEKKESICVHLPNSSLYGSDVLFKDISALQKNSNAKNAIIKFRDSKKEYSLYEFSKNQSSLAPCGNCSSGGMIFSPHIKAENLYFLKVKDLISILETLEINKYIPEHSSIKLLGEITRREIPNSSYIQSLSDEDIDIIMNGGSFWIGMIPIIEEASRSNINTSKNNKGDLFINKVCPECMGAGLLSDNLFFEMLLKDFFQKTSSEILNIISNKENNLKEHNKDFLYIKDCVKTLIYLGLGDKKINSIIDNLSYGEIKKLKIAKAYIHKVSGSIFLCDDIMVGLDPQSVISAIKILSTVSRNGNCVLMTSQTINQFTEKYVDNILVVDYLDDPNNPIKSFSKPEHNYLLCEQKSIASKEKLKITCKNVVEKAIRSKHCIIFGKSGSGKTMFIENELVNYIKKLYFNNSSITLLFKQGKDDLKQNINLLDYLSISNSIYNRFISSNRGLQNLGNTSKSIYRALLCTYCNGQGTLSIEALGTCISKSCKKCNGSGWSPKANLYTLQGVSLPDIYKMNVNELFNFLNTCNMKHTSHLLSNLISIGGEKITVGTKLSKISSGDIVIIKLSHFLNLINKNIKMFQNVFAIFDEPTNYLEQKRSFLIKEKFKELKNQKNVIIISTCSSVNKCISDTDDEIVVV